MNDQSCLGIIWDNIKVGIKWLRYTWLYLIIAIIFLAFIGESIKLSCVRILPTGGVTCIKQPYFLWFIPLQPDTIREVRSARLSETYNDETGTTYRVELVTGQGIVPLTMFYSSGNATKRSIVNEINVFVNGSNGNMLTVNEPGIFSSENVICLAIWLPISLFINLMWGEIKKTTSRRKTIIKNQTRNNFRSI